MGAGQSPQNHLEELWTVWLANLAKVANVSISEKLSEANTQSSTLLKTAQYELPKVLTII